MIHKQGIRDILVHISVVSAQISCFLHFKNTCKNSIKTQSTKEPCQETVDFLLCVLRTRNMQMTFS